MPVICLWLAVPLTLFQQRSWLRKRIRRLPHLLKLQPLRLPCLLKSQLFEYAVKCKIYKLWYFKGKTKNIGIYIVLFLYQMTRCLASGVISESVITAVVLVHKLGPGNVSLMKTCASQPNSVLIVLETRRRASAVLDILHVVSDKNLIIRLWIT